MNTPYRLKPTRTTLAFVALFAACGLALPLTATAQVAGSTPTSVTVLETSQLALGWSAKKSILGKTVYNDSGQKVGRVEDLIVNPDRNVSYVIVGAGGFIGIGRHDVAVPISQIRQQDGRFLMAGATKDSVKAMAAFSYTDSGEQRRVFIADAEAGLVTARRSLADLERRASNGTAEAKLKLEAQQVTLKADMAAAETRLSEMKQAGAARWHEFEAAVKDASTKLRRSVAAALA
jgi:hypothetical protein